MLVFVCHVSQTVNLVDIETTAAEKEAVAKCKTWLNEKGRGESVGRDRIKLQNKERSGDK